MSGRAFQKYNRYHQWWSKVEKRLFTLAVLVFFTLYGVQLINFVMEQRNSTFLSAAIGKLEGTPIAESQTQLNIGTLELTVVSKSDCKNIKIFINGQYYNSFTQKSVSLKVKNNDIIELSGINSDYPATVKITSSSDNILAPNPNGTLIVNKNFVRVGRIRLK